jgi:alkane 1-monooxygenase
MPRAAGHLSGLEKILLFFGVGVASGTVGIVFSHELMHQKNRLERWLADLLLATVLYSHFRSEHLLVHHRYVGTPRDAVTARYNEGFHRYFFRVLPESYVSAFREEKARLARQGRPWHDAANPFWRYWALQGGCIALALILGGWEGLALFAWQALVAIWQLELTNYIEHYGLTRKHIGGGKYEHVQPRHSWNAAHKVSNWLLINLQRHSDHHYKPDRRFPLLQTYDATEAPQLPFGYPLMSVFAMVPPLWRRVMNPKVRKWRKMYLPRDHRLDALFAGRNAPAQIVVRGPQALAESLVANPRRGFGRPRKKPRRSDRTRRGQVVPRVRAPQARAVSCQRISARICCLRRSIGIALPSRRKHQ